MSHFYLLVVKQGLTGVYLFSLFLIQNIDCGYSLELPRQGGSKVYPQSMFWIKNKKQKESRFPKGCIFVTRNIVDICNKETAFDIEFI